MFGTRIELLRLFGIPIRLDHVVRAARCRTARTVARTAIMVAAAASFSSTRARASARFVASASRCFVVIIGS